MSREFNCGEVAADRRAADPLACDLLDVEPFVTSGVRGLRPRLPSGAAGQPTTRRNAGLWSASPSRSRTRAGLTFNASARTGIGAPLSLARSAAFFSSVGTSPGYAPAGSAL